MSDLHSMEIALETAIPGLNGALQAAIDQHRKTLAALSLVGMRVEFQPQKEVPSPRLVGIELNPGPGPGLARDLASAIGGVLGNAVARTRKAKTTRKPAPRATRKRPNVSNRTRANNGGVNGSLVSDQLSSLTTAPVSGRINTISRTQTASFPVPYKGAILQITTSSSGAPYFVTVGSAAVTSGATNVGLSPYLLTTTDVRFPAAFPSQIVSLAKSFAMYRIKPGTAKLSYRAASSTSLPGQLAISAYPADYPILNPAVDYLDVSSSECAITTSPWAACMYFDPKALNSVLCSDVAGGWKYCDYDGTVTQPEIRQDTFLNFMVNALGMPLVNEVVGTLFLECVLEFKHIQNTALLTAARVEKQRLLQASASSTSSSSSVPSLPSVVPPATPAAVTTQEAPAGWFRIP